MPNKKANRSSYPSNLLVIRFSAIGDVAMTVPTLWSMSKQYPDCRITLVSQGFARYFVEQIPNVGFFEAKLKGQHRGFLGMFRLYRELRAGGNYDAVVDLHDVIRSKFLRLLFTLSGVRCAKINKGRRQKQQLTRKENKKMVQLPTTFDRYAQTFNKLGFEVTNRFDYLYTNVLLPEAVTELIGKKRCSWIGIAPFAKHAGKVYPLPMMERAVEKLSNRDEILILLFGGGKQEESLLEEWALKYCNVISVAGKFSLADELKIISNLDVLISMDSANMHFASLVNTPVVSIWGATHPFAGFYGWQQNPNHAIHIELPCRPCSVYGNKPCYNKSNACLNLISPEMIYDKIRRIIGEGFN